MYMIQCNIILYTWREHKEKRGGGGGDKGPGLL